eukprot:CAMPEP_0115036316 /NCGR_PEP_ID=MMETSP0216-20121206/42043_1 /TAXON_ID=223996 /ORGANISM="Protocruzia adherens, Strain Boccale" /LENGTH=62 /DNA_ID=CAMNT_0002416107 /DNA_START=56 /DNA_END=240 /DNA_ORIENTATION=-
MADLTLAVGAGALKTTIVCTAALYVKYLACLVAQAGKSFPASARAPEDKVFDSDKTREQKWG